MSNPDQICVHPRKSLALLVYGMVIGAGAVAVGVLLMKDKKNQAKVSEAVAVVKDKVKDKVKEYVDEVETKVKKVSKDLE